jgi:protein gp37
MGAQSKIEWTDSTFNPWVGCTKIDRPGDAPSACDFCYAEKWAKRSGMVKWGNFSRRRTTPSYWRGPISWNANAREFQRKHGRRQRVFCASLADVFDNQVDPQWREDMFRLICTCDQLDWQLLTKRPQNIRKMLPADWGAGYPNVWLGTTAEDGHAYRQRAPHLLKVPARIHFISYEPAMGPLGRLDVNGLTPDWVIIGGESGVAVERIRFTDPQWVREAIAECRRVGAAPFLKQWGNYRNNPRIVEEKRSIEEAARLDPPENGKGGGKLDGKLWREFPSIKHILKLPGDTAGRHAGNGNERRTIFS